MVKSDQISSSSVRTT